MNKKTLTAHGTGTVLALRHRNGWHAPVRLMDTDPWYRVATGNGPYFTATHGKTSSFAVKTNIGYPVLRILSPGSLTDVRMAELTELLGTVELTTEQVINPDGSVNWDALPAGLGFDIVTTRELTGTWTEIETARQAEAAAYQARIDADRARWDAKAAAQRAEHDRVAAAKKTQSDRFVDDLGALGVNNMITMVSEHSVMVDVRTLEALIAMAQGGTVDAEIVDDVPTIDTGKIVPGGDTIPNINPDARLVELIAIECRECGDRSPWGERDTAWEVAHYKTEHPGVRPSKWRTYRWTVTRQTPKYF